MTTFAREYLPTDVGIMRFVDADLLAAGLSPLRPTSAAVAAGRLRLSEIDRLTKQRVDFAFESTPNGVGYVRRLNRLRTVEYHIEIIYLRLGSPRLALRRIEARVRQGEHDVSKADVLRRYVRCWDNLQSVYKPLADAWATYEKSGSRRVLIETGP